VPAGVLKQLDHDASADLSLYMDGMHLFGPCCCIVHLFLTKDAGPQVINKGRNECAGGEYVLKDRHK